MPISDLLASISGDATRTSAAPAPLSQKRKAENDLRGTSDKNMRREQNSANTSRPVLPIRQLSSQNVMPTRPAVSTIAKTPAPSRQPPTSRPLTTQRPPTISEATRTMQPAANAASASASTKPPKKGSFAEIMARGKAATATMGQVGKIQHKKIEKPLSRLAKEERGVATKAGSQKSASGKDLASAGRAGALGRDGKSSLKDIKGRPSPQPAVPEKKVKKAALATTGYTGTARPIPGKASRPALSSGHRAADRGRGRDRRDEYESEEDEEGDEEEDEQEDYYSDASSDMEAATFEVDEEEERATRIARKEDAEALNEETRLKREKEEKRRKLAAMAKARTR